MGIYILDKQYMGHNYFTTETECPRSLVNIMKKLILFGHAVLMKFTLSTQAPVHLFTGPRRRVYK